MIDRSQVPDAVLIDELIRFEVINDLGAVCFVISKAQGALHIHGLLQRVERILVTAQVFIVGTAHQQGVLVAGVQPAVDQLLIQPGVQAFQPGNFGKAGDVL